MIGRKWGQTPIFYFPISKREKLEREIQYFIMPWLHNYKSLLLQITIDYLTVRLVIFIGSQNLQSTAGRAPGRFHNYLSPFVPVSYTHLRAHETGRNLVCRLLLEKKKK